MHSSPANVMSLKSRANLSDPLHLTAFACLVPSHNFLHHHHHHRTSITHPGSSMREPPAFLFGEPRHCALPATARILTEKPNLASQPCSG